MHLYFCLSSISSSLFLFCTHFPLLPPFIPYSSSIALSHLLLNVPLRMSRLCQSRKSHLGVCPSHKSLNRPSKTQDSLPVNVFRVARTPVNSLLAWFLKQSSSQCHLVPITVWNGWFDAQHVQIVTRWTGDWMWDGCTHVRTQRDCVHIMHGDLWVKIVSTFYFVFCCFFFLGKFKATKNHFSMLRNVCESWPQTR